MFHRGESEPPEPYTPRYRVTCTACGRSEDLPGPTRSGNCRVCGHDEMTVSTVAPPPPPPPPPQG